MSKKKVQWADLSSTRKAWLVAAGAVQLSLALYAWVDLARRAKSEVRGPKSRWAGIIGINYVGPLVYLKWGRTKDDSASHAA